MYWAQLSTLLLDSVILSAEELDATICPMPGCCRVIYGPSPSNHRRVDLSDSSDGR
jgi:hypothetical protein